MIYFLFKTATFFILMVIANATLACSCMLGDAEQKLAEAEHVFIGQVISITHKGTKNSFGDEETQVIFKVLESWKGQTNKITLDTANNGVGCIGYWFKSHNIYLVYAYRVDGKQLDTYYCGGVYPITNIEFIAEIIALNTSAPGRNSE